MTKVYSRVGAAPLIELAADSQTVAPDEVRMRPSNNRLLKKNAVSLLANTAATPPASVPLKFVHANSIDKTILGQSPYWDHKQVNDKKGKAVALKEWQSLLKRACENAGHNSADGSTPKVIKVVQFVSARAIQNPTKSSHCPLELLISEEQKKSTRIEQGECPFKIINIEEPASNIKVQLIEIAPNFNGRSIQAKDLKQLSGILENEGFVQQDSNGKWQLADCLLGFHGVGRPAALKAYYDALNTLNENRGITVDDAVSASIQNIKNSRSHHCLPNEQRRELVEALNQCNTADNNTENKNVNPNDDADLHTNDGDSITEFDVNSPALKGEQPIIEIAPMSIKTPPRFLEIQELCSDKVTIQANGTDAHLPVCPINFKGLQQVTREDWDQFIAGSNGLDLKRNATHIIKGIWLGDCLGSGTESHLGHYVNMSQSTAFEARKAVLELETGTRRPTNADELGHYSKLLSHPCIIGTEKPKIQLNRGRTGISGPTDDTQQTALAMMSHLENGLETNAEHLSDLYIEPNFGEAKRFTIHGSAGSIELLKANIGKPWAERCRVRSDDQNLVENTKAAGNGALMRIGGTVAACIMAGKSSDACAADVVLSGQVTHPDSFSHAANVGFAMLMLRAVAFQHRVNKPKKKDKFFLTTVVSAMREIEVPGKKYPLGPTAKKPAQIEDETWRTLRLLPSEFLAQRTDATNQPVQVPEQLTVVGALDEKKKPEESDCDFVDKMIQRWGSNSYLGATVPSVIFILETYGYDDPAKAVEIAALCTQDNDTCAAIVGAVMGAMHGGEWIMKLEKKHQNLDKLQDLTCISATKPIFSLKNLVDKMTSYAPPAKSKAPDTI